jgi:hypothetical protein
VLRRTALGAFPVLLLVLGTIPAAAKTTTALHVAASNPPEAVFGSDGREHVEYDLVLTNAFSGDATLGAVWVRADGKPALTLAGDGLTAATHKLFTSDPTATVDGVHAGRPGPAALGRPHSAEAHHQPRRVRASRRRALADRHRQHRLLVARPAYGPAPAGGDFGTAERRRLGQRERML